MVADYSTVSKFLGISVEVETVKKHSLLIYKSPSCLQEPMHVILSIKGSAVLCTCAV